jgi:hypothetical protein
MNYKDKNYFWICFDRSYFMMCEIIIQLSIFLVFGGFLGDKDNPTPMGPSELRRDT